MTQQGQPRPGQPGSTGSDAKKGKGRGKKLLGLFVLAVCAALTALAFIPATFYVAGSGHILSAQDAVLRAGSKGPIHVINVKSGQRVQQGQIVIELESELEQSEVDRCKRQVAESKAQWAYLKEQLGFEQKQEQLQLRLAAIEKADAEAELLRVKALQQQNVASDREFQAAKVAFDLADVECRRRGLDREGVRQATLKVQQRRIATLEAQLTRAKNALARRKIRAPLTGLIMLHALSIGRVVDANEVLGQVFDDKYYQVVARLPERYSAFLRKGQQVQVELGAYSHWQFGYFTGKVYWVSPVVEPHSSGDGSILIKAKLTNVPQDVSLKAGMSAPVWIDAGKVRLLWKLIGIRNYDRKSQPDELSHD